MCNVVNLFYYYFVSLADSIAANTTLRAELRMYENNVKELQNLNQMLRDEHQALQLAFASLEEKLRKAQVHRIEFFICNVWCSR